MAYDLIFNVLLIIIGFVLLTKSAPEAIKRALLLSEHWGFSEFVVSFIFIGGIAILPELLIGVISALSGVSSFGAGIVMGANIADLTLIIGIVAFFTKGINLSESTFKNLKLIFLFLFLPFILFLDGELSRIDGGVLILAFLMYLVIMFKRTPKIKPVKLGIKPISVSREAGILIIAIIIMIFSANLITESAQSISSLLVLPIFFIGIIIAIGTCLPELIIALKSNKHNHGELGLGDILGNVFADTLLTLGVIAIIAPIRPQFPLQVIFSSFLIIFSMLTIIILSRSENRISKDEGLFIIIMYLFFVGLQFGLEYIFVN